MNTPIFDWQVINSSHGVFLVNKCDEIGDCIVRQEHYEMHIQEIYTKIIQPYYVGVDAGANLGYHSIQFGKLCHKVYAFEPQPMIYNQLCSNILFNKLDYIIDPIKKGLGYKKEVKQLSPIEDQHRAPGGNREYPLWNWGGRGIEEEPSKIRDHDQIEITTLDSYNLKRCDFIKMDIQGYEFYAFKGSSNLLTKHKPIIFLENYTDQILDKKAKEYLINLGYEFYRMSMGKKNMIYSNQDCIAIHPQNPNYQTQMDIIDTHFLQFKDKFYINKENE